MQVKIAVAAVVVAVVLVLVEQLTVQQNQVVRVF
jgi:hypothetical protein